MKRPNVANKSKSGVSILLSKECQIRVTKTIRSEPHNNSAIEFTCPLDYQGTELASIKPNLCNDGFKNWKEQF
jgi:hypothetical protein